MRPLRNMWRMPWSTAVGVLLGVGAVLVTPAIVGPMRDAYDHVFPVLRMTGALVEREPDAVIVHISGQKLRGDECRLLSVYGYAVMPDGRFTDASATRIDAPQTGRVRDKGHYDIGRWRVIPVTMGAARVMVVAQHDCVGRVVLSTIADVAL